MSLEKVERLMSKEWLSWRVDTYNEHKRMFNVPYRIDVNTWILLAAVISQRNIKSVIEFGSGLSTVLMDRLGVKVVSFENFPEYLHQFELENSEIITYNDFSALPILDADMAFIDGPGGIFERELGYQYVAHGSIPVMVCHDADRLYVRKLLKRYFTDWSSIGKSGDRDGVCSLALMKEKCD